MFQVLGYAIGIYLLYAILALIFKHKGGFVISNIMNFAIGVIGIIVNFDFLPIVSGVVFFLLLCWIPALHVRDDNKAKRKEKKSL